MRADPVLCFLEKVGGPDAQAIAAEYHAQDYAELPERWDLFADNVKSACGAVRDELPC